MAKIPFNIDYRPQIESGEYKVVTSTDDPVRILAWDLLGDYPIAAAKWEEGDPHSTCVDTYDTDGWDGMGTKQTDLYIVTPEPAPVISEDERIRKELIDAIQGLWDDDALPMPLSLRRKDAWLAWLEKQQEQKPTINIKHLKSYMLQYLQDAANRKDDSEIEADTDKWAKKIIELINKSYNIGFRDGIASVSAAEWSEEDKMILAKGVKPRDS